MSGNKTLKQNKPVVQRLFFALWPSVEIKQQLIKLTKQVAKHSDGRRVRDDNLHLTLRFLGSVTEDKQKCIEQIANDIQFEPFELILDQLVFRKKQEMVWLTTDNAIPDSLQNMVEQLETGVQECGFAPEKYPFKPHITLIRKTRKTKELSGQVNLKWFADAFVLVRSKTWQEGVEYSVVKEWKL